MFDWAVIQMNRPARKDFADDVDNLGFIDVVGIAHFVVVCVDQIRKVIIKARVYATITALALTQEQRLHLRARKHVARKCDLFLVVFIMDVNRKR